MQEFSDQDALEQIVGRLDGRTIVGSELAVDGGGFHIFLNDGAVLIISGTFIVGIHRPVADRTIQ